MDDAGRKDFFQQQRRREIASEEIKGSLGCVWSAATGKDAAVKTEVINALFGTHSWTAFEKLPPDVLEDGHEHYSHDDRRQGLRPHEEPGDLADAARPGTGYVGHLPV
jgi:hypothetical protein